MNCWLYPRVGNPLELTGVQRGGTQEKRVWWVHGREEGSRTEVQDPRVQGTGSPEAPH